MAKLIPTPSQTVGPFFKHGLKWDSEGRVFGNAPGQRITVTGIVVDGADEPIPDAFLEVWQADAKGAVSRAAVGEDGNAAFARAPTDAQGRFVIDTVMPGGIAQAGGGVQTPYLMVTIFARGLLRHLFTRCYFEDAPGVGEDPVLASLGERARTLVARKTADGKYEWNIALQGDTHVETVFFDI